MFFMDSLKRRYKQLKEYSSHIVTSIQTNISKIYKSRPIQAAKSFVAATATQLWAVGKFLYQSPDVRKKVRDFVVQSWQGLRSTLRFRTLYATVRKNPKLRKLIKQSFINNIVLYAGPVIVYQWSKSLMCEIAPDFPVSFVGRALDYSIRTLFFSFYIGNLIKNLSYTASITYETSKIATNHPFASCDCNKGLKIQADLESVFYYPRNLLTAKLVSIGGYYPGKIVSALAYGQCLVEYKLSQVGMCTEHRSKEFSKNNAYILSYGFSFIVMTELLNWLLAGSTVSFFINDATSNFVFQLYAMLALLQDKPLPGNQEGIDFFKFNRLELSQMANTLVPALSDDSIRNRLAKSVSAFINFPPIKLTAASLFILGLFPLKMFCNDPMLLFSKKLLTAQELLKIRELRELVEINANTIDAIQWIYYLRSGSIIGAVLVGIYASKPFVFVLDHLNPTWVNAFAELPVVAKHVQEELDAAECDLLLVSVSPLNKLPLELVRKAYVLSPEGLYYISDINEPISADHLIKLDSKKTNVQALWELLGDSSVPYDKALTTLSAAKREIIINKTGHHYAFRVELDEKIIAQDNYIPVPGEENYNFEIAREEGKNSRLSQGITQIVISNINYFDSIFARPKAIKHSLSFDDVLKNTVHRNSNDDDWDMMDDVSPLQQMGLFAQSRKISDENNHHAVVSRRRSSH